MDENDISTWGMIVAFFIVLTVSYFVYSEDYYNRKVQEAISNPPAKISRIIPSPEATPKIKLSYEQWRRISEKMLKKMYIPWEHKKLTEKTINDFIFMTRIYFDDAMEEIKKEKAVE